MQQIHIAVNHFDRFNLLVRINIFLFNCSNRLEKFQCHSGECIEDKLLCDGTAHCKDSSDEAEVECEKSEHNRTKKSVQCKANQFTCNNGECISTINVCDGTSNCADGSDEKSTICRSLP